MPPLPPAHILVSSLPLVVLRLSRFNTVYGSTRVTSATTASLYRRISVVRVATRCGTRFTSYAGYDGRTVARVASYCVGQRGAASLCFFYSSVIKQFNITNTGLDNTFGLDRLHDDRGCLCSGSACFVTCTDHFWVDR